MAEALEAVRTVGIVEAVQDYQRMMHDAKLVEHMGYRWHRHRLVNWIYDAQETSLTSWLYLQLAFGNDLSPSALMVAFVIVPSHVKSGSFPPLIPLLSPIPIDTAPSTMESMPSYPTKRLAS